MESHRKNCCEPFGNQSRTLLVLGKKQISDGSGVNARRVARNVKSAIWFVTAKATTDIRNILVPVDFSGNSLRALEAALELRKHLKDVTITALHVIDIPMTAYKINRNKDAIIAEMKASATNRFLRVLSQNEIDKAGLNFQLLMNDEFDVARYIQKTAAQENADLIIVGGKGYSLLDNFLFGSVTEKLVNCEHEIPVLVMRATVIQKSSPSCAEHSSPQYWQWRCLPGIPLRRPR